MTGKGYWDHFTGNNITDELRAQGVTDPTLRNLQDFNASVGGPFIKDRLWWFGSFRNYSTVDATRGLHGGELGRQPDQPVRLEPAQLHGERQVSGQQEQPVVGILDLQPEIPAAPRRGRRPSHFRQGTLHQESPKNLINANWTSVMGQNTFLEVSSTYFHMHWPSTWADEFNALPANQQFPATFNITHRHLHRRPGADRASASATPTGIRPTSA